MHGLKRQAVLRQPGLFSGLFGPTYLHAGFGRIFRPVRDAGSGGSRRFLQLGAAVFALRGFLLFGGVGVALGAVADAGFRTDTDLRNEKIGYKIREAQVQKTPYMLILGDKEAEAGTVAVRNRKGQQTVMGLEEFISRLTEERDSRSVAQIM